MSEDHDIIVMVTGGRVV